MGSTEVILFNGSPQLSGESSICLEPNVLTLTLPSATIVILANFLVCAENIEHTISYNTQIEDA